jgi:methylated-DNA-[protein]-cysteine S-methyltransferase
MTAYATTTVPSPVGTLTLLASDAGLRAILWEGEAPGDRVPWPPDVREDPNHPVLMAAREQLQEYFAGDRRSFDVPIDLHGTPFQVKVWRALASIPYGETTTYGEQARMVGDAKKARAVGAANGKNPVSIILPCHRVVGADGTLTGFAAGLESKRALLDLEASVVAASA